MNPVATETGPRSRSGCSSAAKTKNGWRREDTSRLFFALVGAYQTISNRTMVLLFRSCRKREHSCIRRGNADRGANCGGDR